MMVLSNERAETAEMMANPPPYFGNKFKGKPV